MLASANQATRPQLISMHPSERMVISGEYGSAITIVAKPSSDRIEPAATFND
jgi:hypothetical protein